MKNKIRDVDVISPYPTQVAVMAPSSVARRRRLKGAWGSQPLPTGQEGFQQER